MFRFWKLWLALLLLVALAGGFAAWRQRQPGVSVTLDPALPALGHAKRTVTLTLRAASGDLASVQARVIQQGKEHTILAEELGGSARQTQRPLVLEAAALGLTEGPAELHVFARDRLWRPRPDLGPRLVHRFTVDLTPPTIELRAATGYIRHAGVGVAVYRTVGGTRSGVRAGSAFFPGTAGLAQDPAIHVALFTIPYSEPPAPPSLVAEDEAGNQRIIGVPVTLLPARFPKDTIRLTEPFLRRKVPELAPQTSGTASPAELLEAFLRINREGRKDAEGKIRALTQAGSAPKPLWHGAFRQQPNTKVFANFPEERTYLADGNVVDTQWHLGIDLASRKQTPVEASNAGRVVFTGPNGIYGNMVVLDHGLGLYTLYGHLSEIGVKVGQTAAKGETIGRSGETGFAGGDHLHFAVLIQGVYATPLEWWDAQWIRDRIAKPLTEAGLSLDGITDGAATPQPAAATPSAPRAPRRVRRR